MPPELARAVSRGGRSAIGTWSFAYGGFIVEGGHRPREGTVAPLLGRYEVPESWRYVVAVPPGEPGLSGEAESTAFEQLPAPPERDPERVAHLVLMQLLPSLVEGDLAGFGAALTAIQRLTGAWFAARRAGSSRPGWRPELIARMAEWGAAGVGQSSWGPAVYGLVEGADRGRALAERSPRRSPGARTGFRGGFRPARGPCRVGWTPCPTLIDSSFLQAVYWPT